MRSTRLTGLLWVCLFLLTAAALPAPAKGRLMIYAAGSLTDPFHDLKKVFEAGHPGVEVELNLAGSPELRTQIELGAPWDIFASADMQNMQALQKQHMALKPRVFARNRVCVIVPKANRARIRTLADLARPGIRIVAGHENLPIGKYMVKILDKMDRSGQFGSGFKDRVLKNIASRELNVKQIVAKIGMDDFDAGFAFVTDITPAVRKNATLLSVPAALNIIAAYPIAVSKTAPAPALAQEFVKLVVSPQGQRILKRYGFLKP
ncbi:MAG: molybdate ABC transporter substrate-binding protein [Armatimonadetes bacterium]|nr:molybdate ABC transporter substrate-binding protein [Armatimonadota bacterium]